jgi:hypothetical protein
MSVELTRKNPPARRRLARRNTMAFPRALRDAIPALHTGRILELESIDGQASYTILMGPMVQLKLVVQETGKLSGKYVVRMDLQPEAARELASTLTRLADQLTS